MGDNKMVKSNIIDWYGTRYLEYDAAIFINNNKPIYNLFITLNELYSDVVSLENIPVSHCISPISDIYKVNNNSIAINIVYPDYVIESKSSSYGKLEEFSIDKGNDNSILISTQSRIGFFNLVRTKTIAIHFECGTCNLCTTNNNI